MEATLCQVTDINAVDTVATTDELVQVDALSSTEMSFIGGGMMCVSFI